MMEANNEVTISLNCDIDGTGNSNNKDQNNVSVILVPENVLQALSDSSTAYNPLDAADTAAYCSDITQNNSHLVDLGSNQCNLNGKNLIIVNNDILNCQENSDVLVVDPRNICVIGDLNSENQNLKFLENATSFSAVNNKPRPIKPHPAGVPVSTSQDNSSTVQEESSNKEKDDHDKALLNCMDGFLEQWVVEPEKNINKRPIPFKCKIFNCNKTFKSEKELETHSLKHKKCERYPCRYPNCPWSFPTPYKLKRHLKSHDKVKQYKCTYAGCDRICSTKYNLQAHLNMHNENGAFRFCPECNATFTHHAQLLKHLRTVHNAVPKYECEECGKKFHTMSGRNTHVKSHTLREYICGVEGCGKRFNRRAIFKIHVMRHSNIRPYKCQYPDCQWAFTTKEKLKRHVMTHSNIKRYQCPVENCAGQFARLEHLKSHLKVHTMKSSKGDDGANELEAPIESQEDNLLYYLCPYEDCGSLFTTLIGAKQHIQKVHTQISKQSSSDISCNKNAGDIILETQPVSITLEAMKTNYENDEIPDDSTISDDNASANEKIINDQESTESLLRTMLQEDSDVAEQSSDDLLITSVTSLAPESQSESMVYINTISNDKPSSSQTIELSSNHIFSQTRGLSNSPTTTIDPSQFLLGTSEEYSAESEAMKYINIPQYPPSSSTDRFLNFSESCVQTVDPNMVMSIPAALPMFQRPTSTVSSSYESSDDDDSSTCDDNNNLRRTSGAARTDIFMRRRNFKDSFDSSLKQLSSPSHSNNTNKLLLSEPSDHVSDFDADIQSFIFSDVNRKDDISLLNGRPESLLEKRSHITDSRFMKEPRSLQGDFAESTINLNDLA